jgi:hypothetical protein
MARVDEFSHESTPLTFYGQQACSSGLKGAPDIHNKLHLEWHEQYRNAEMKN